METMTRGELAKKCGVNIEALRYYEKRKLIDPPKRSETGYRLYTEDDVTRIRFIKNAQKLGFSLNEILELLKLRIYKNKSCEEARKKSQAKLEDVDNKIKTLKIIKRSLKELIKQCEEAIPTNHCPILSEFETQNHR
jgi:MerR family transcriptional regulator, Zn(II)-responsive regulator of zntA